jgi:hypothetical protein
MNITIIITAAFVLGLVWGGLVFFLIRALKYEKKKLMNGEE